MSGMRSKLNDHIVYLQNEIRKRDELLEGESDFEDNFEDSASNVSQDHSMSNTPRRPKKQYVSIKILDEAR